MGDLGEAEEEPGSEEEDAPPPLPFGEPEKGKKKRKEKEPLTRAYVESAPIAEVASRFPQRLRLWREENTDPMPPRSALLSWFDAKVNAPERHFLTTGKLVPMTMSDAELAELFAKKVGEWKAEHPGQPLPTDLPRKWAEEHNFKIRLRSERRRAKKKGGSEATAAEPPPAPSASPLGAFDRGSAGDQFELTLDAPGGPVRLRRTISVTEKGSGLWTELEFKFEFLDGAERRFPHSPDHLDAGNAAPTDAALVQMRHEASHPDDASLRDFLVLEIFANYATGPSVPAEKARPFKGLSAKLLRSALLWLSAHRRDLLPLGERTAVGTEVFNQRRTLARGTAAAGDAAALARDAADQQALERHYRSLGFARDERFATGESPGSTPMSSTVGTILERTARLAGGPEPARALPASMAAVPPPRLEPPPAPRPAPAPKRREEPEEPDPCQMAASFSAEKLAGESEYRLVRQAPPDEGAHVRAEISPYFFVEGEGGASFSCLDEPAIKSLYRWFLVTRLFRLQPASEGAGEEPSEAEEGTDADAIFFGGRNRGLEDGEESLVVRDPETWRFRVRPGTYDAAALWLARKLEAEGGAAGDLSKQRVTPAYLGEHRQLLGPAASEFGDTVLGLALFLIAKEAERAAAASKLVVDAADRALAVVAEISVPDVQVDRGGGGGAGKEEKITAADISAAERAKLDAAVAAFYRPATIDYGAAAKEAVAEAVLRPTPSGPQLLTAYVREATRGGAADALSDAAVEMVYQWDELLEKRGKGEFAKAIVSALGWPAETTRQIAEAAERWLRSVRFLHRAVLASAVELSDVADPVSRAVATKAMNKWEGGPAAYYREHLEALRGARLAAAAHLHGVQAASVALDQIRADLEEEEKRREAARRASKRKPAEEGAGRHRKGPREHRTIRTISLMPPAQGCPSWPAPRVRSSWLRPTGRRSASRTC